MSISNDIWQEIQSGELERFCRDGCFPTEHTFVIVFWNQYVNEGNANWDDYRPALDELVDRNHLKQSQNEWYMF